MPRYKLSPEERAAEQERKENLRNIMKGLDVKNFDDLKDGKTRGRFYCLDKALFIDILVIKVRKYAKTSKKKEQKQYISYYTQRN